MVTMQKVRNSRGTESGGPRHSPREGKEARGRGEGRGSDAAEDGRFRPRRAPAAPHLSRSRDARVRDEGGRRGERGLRPPARGRLHRPRRDPALALPELKEVQDKVRSDLVEERALESAKGAAADVKTRAAASRPGQGGGRARARPQGDPRARRPRPAPGRPGNERCSWRTLAFALPEKTLSDPVRVPAGYAILRVLEKKAFDPAAFAKQKALDRGLAARAEEERALPGLHERGPRALHASSASPRPSNAW